jgi:hypothetical protein
VKYLTGSWAKAQSYTWSEAQTTSLTFSGNVTSEAKSIVKAQLGLAGGFTTTYSVAISVPADPTRYSKLAFASDYWQQYISYVRTVTYYTTYGGYGSYSEPRVHTTYQEPTENTYLQVIYQ